MRSFICKLVYWIMLKLYVFILWALLPLLTMVEKPRDFDPFGHAGLSPLVTI